MLASPPTPSRSSAGITLDGLLDVRQGELSRDVAWIGSAPRDQLPQQGSGDERHLALHVRLGSIDPTCRRSLRCRARFGSSHDPQHRPRPSGDVHDAGELGPARAWHGRPGRARHCRREASSGGAARHRRDGAADPPAGLVGRVRCDRRRSGSRARRSARVPVERRVHDLAARAPRPANGRRAACGRRDHPPDDRRSSARLLGRDDELRARAGARPLRRRSRNGARQRRLVDAGVRGNGAELAVGREGACRLDRAHAPVLRGVRAAAARGGRVAQRRRRRRDAEAVLQDRATLDRRRRRSPRRTARSRGRSPAGASRASTTSRSRRRRRLHRRGSRFHRPPSPLHRPRAAGPSRFPRRTTRVSPPRRRGDSPSTRPLRPCASHLRWSSSGRQAGRQRSAGRRHERRA